eukprot:s4001_g5.t1
MATATGKSAVNALTLRSEAIAHLKKYKERYLNDWDGLAPCGRRLWSQVDSVEAKGPAFDTYLKEVASPTAWSCELEASALARKYNMKVVILPQKLDFAPAALHNVGTQVMALWFLGDHFDALVPDSGSELPEDVRAVTDGLLVTMRGGGGPGCRSCYASSSCAKAAGSKRSGQTVWTPVNSRQTVWTTAEDNVLDLAFGEKPQTRRRLVGKQRVSNASVSNSAVFVSSEQRGFSDLGEHDEALRPLTKWEQYKSRGSKKQKADGIFEWTCTMCPFVCQGSSSSQDSVCKKRYDHVKHHHDGVGLPGGLKRPDNVVVAKPGKKPCWKGPLCAWGISRQMRSSISETIYYSERHISMQSYPAMTWVGTMNLQRAGVSKNKAVAALLRDFECSILGLQEVDLNFSSNLSYVEDWQRLGYSCLLGPLDEVRHIHRAALLSCLPISPVRLAGLSAPSRSCAGVIDIDCGGGVCEKLLVCTFYGTSGDETNAVELLTEVVKA